MASATVVATRCLDCIEIHTKEARSAGTKATELAETAILAAVLHAGVAIACTAQHVRHMNCRPHS